MAKIIDAKAAAQMVKEQNSILFGGFLACGAAENLVDALVKEGTKHLHLVAIATDFDNKGNGKLVANSQVKSVQTSHIGTNKSTQEQFNAGVIDLELVPQGTLMERVRAAGAGLGGILTPTGVGTSLEEKKQIIEIDGKKFFLETPIKGDFAFVRAKKADKDGNLIYSKSALNSNPIMAMAGKTTIVEVDEIVELGELSPEEIVTPGIFVDYIVKHEE